MELYALILVILQQPKPRAGGIALQEWQGANNFCVSCILSQHSVLQGDVEELADQLQAFLALI